MRNVTILLLGAFLVCACTACADMGRTFGKAGAKIEQKMDSFSQGYKEGRNTEIKKEKEAEQSEEKRNATPPPAAWQPNSTQPSSPAQPQTAPQPGQPATSSPHI